LAFLNSSSRNCPIEIWAQLKHSVAVLFCLVSGETPTNAREEAGTAATPFQTRDCAPAEAGEYCAEPQQRQGMKHPDIYWNVDTNEWCCVRCGRCSNHLNRYDAEYDLSQFDCTVSPDNGDRPKNPTGN
jgi:hypothetical protein